MGNGNRVVGAELGTGFGTVASLCARPHKRPVLWPPCLVNREVYLFEVMIFLSQLVGCSLLCKTYLFVIGTFQMRKIKEQKKWRREACKE